jgi:hypothetical protein
MQAFATPPTEDWIAQLSSFETFVLVNPSDKQGEPINAALSVCTAVMFDVGATSSAIGREPTRRTAKQVRLLPEATAALNTAALVSALAAKHGDVGPLSKGMSLEERRTLTVTKLAPRPATVNKTARGPGPGGFDAGRGKALSTSTSVDHSKVAHGTTAAAASPLAADSDASQPSGAKGGRVGGKMARASDTFADAD